MVPNRLLSSLFNAEQTMEDKKKRKLAIVVVNTSTDAYKNAAAVKSIIR